MSGDKWTMGKVGDHEWTLGDGAEPLMFVDTIGGEVPTSIDFGEGRKLTLCRGETMRFVAVLKNPERPEEGTRWEAERAGAAIAKKGGMT